MRAATVVAAIVLSGTGGGSAQTGEPHLTGFTSAGAEAQLARERQFKGLPSASIAEEYFDVLSAEPHHTGSPYQIKLAQYVGDLFRSFGMEVSRYQYDVLIPWPGEQRLELVAPVSQAIQVDEDTLPGDPFAARPGIIPAYNAYSPSGDVTGELVYVNYGVPADYEALAALGIDVKGKIVIARYGGSWRGIKPKVAAEHGALGCIIYSDPRDDGYFHGGGYPDGPYRGAGMVQRGSVMDMPRYPGDPTTPGRPSKPGIERLPMEQVTTFAPIPVVPISHRAGEELLKRLAGPVAPEAWRGALGLTYRLGPGPASVRLRLQMDYAQRPLVNVVGRIRGSELPDEWVVIGSHRDAWVFGALDPVSSHASMLDIARSFGELVRSGWRPRRSILFVSWDGEEQGLLGSTEWVEDHLQEVRARTVIYVNRDAATGRGWFSAGGVHSLTTFVHELARAVQDPAEPAKTLYDRWLERARDQHRGDGEPPASPPLNALGSGSDYTAFLDHAGVSVLDMGIGSDANRGTYHSTYDHPIWFKKFVDPGFVYTVAATQVAGLALMRFADAAILPLDYESYGRQIASYAAEIEKESAKEPGAAAVDFAALRAAAERLARAGAALRAHGEALLSASAVDAPAIADVNRRLMAAERSLIDPEGLPERPWFKHTVYAPGFYTGYGVKTLPGVREAVEAKNFELANRQAVRVIQALERAAATLEGKGVTGSVHLPVPVAPPA
jgi:N-acetylated-alpha-linked acidic dipeptidase